MFERSDGALIRVEVVKETRNLTVSLFRINAKKDLTLKVTEAELDELFRFDPILMNPNKTHERYMWIAERIAIVKSGQEDTLVLMKVPMAPLKPVIFDSNFKLPLGRLNANERDRLHNQVLSVDHKRELNIANKLEARHSTFTSYLRSLRASKENADAVMNEMLVQEAVELTQSRDFQQDHQKMSQHEIAQKDLKRRSTIENKMLKREERDSYWVSKIERTKLEDENARERKKADRKEKRDTRNLNREDERANFIKAMEALSRQREVAYAERGARWESKAHEYLRSRMEAIKAAQRKQILLKEKKQAQLYSLFF